MDFDTMVGLSRGTEITILIGSEGFQKSKRFYQGHTQDEFKAGESGPLGIDGTSQTHTRHVQQLRRARQRMRRTEASSAAVS